MVAKVINLALRGLQVRAIYSRWCSLKLLMGTCSQFFWAVLIIALTGNMIAEATNGNPSSVNFAIFCGIFGLLSLFYLIPATVNESFAFHPLIMIAIDALNTLFWFAAAVALAAKLRVHSCGNIVSQRSITSKAYNHSC